MNGRVKALHPTYRRVYVCVTSRIDFTGYMQPESVTWRDGRTFPIQRVQDFRPAAACSTRCDCYTVIIHNQERHLYFQREDPTFPSHIGRWFVEVPA